MSTFGDQVQGGYKVDFVPPSDFRPKQLPPIANANPSPPRWLKYQVYTDPLVFATIDEHAIKVARANYDSFTALIYNLVYSKSFTPLERLRLIYRWLTARNLQTINFQQTQQSYGDLGFQPGSPEDVIVGFRHRRSTYSKIFETMCLTAGIPCTLVTGVAKGIEYRPGVRVAQYRTGAPIEKEQQYNHSWNAVFIDNSWQLVDVQWGTRFLQTSADAYSANRPDESLIYEYDDFYFMPDPSHLVYSHYPDDERWQLMPNPVAFDVFQSLPLAKSHFFIAELQFWSHNQGVVYAPTGSVKLSIGYWKPVGFTYKIWDADTMSQDYNGIPLNRFAIQEIGDGIVNYYVKLPYAGSFFFSVFCQRLDEMEVGKPAVYNAACEYKIVANRAATSPQGGPVIPYPDVDSTYGYGSSLYYYQYGLHPSFKAGVIQASLPSNDFELSFAKTKQPRVFFRLRPLNDTTGTVELPIDIRDTSQMAKVVGHLPAKGEYVLEVYANDPATDGNQYTHIGQYMVVGGGVDLPEFRPGPPQSSPAGFARYPDTYELQSSKPLSKLVYHPSAAANSLPPQQRPVKEKTPPAPTSQQSVGTVAFSTTRDNNKTGVTVHATPYTPSPAANASGTKYGQGVEIAVELPAPPPDWSEETAHVKTSETRQPPPRPGPSVAPKPYRQSPPIGQQASSSSPVIGRKQAPQVQSQPATSSPSLDRNQNQAPQQQSQQPQQLFPPTAVNITFDEPAVSVSSGVSRQQAAPPAVKVSTIGAPAPFYQQGSPPRDQPKQPPPPPPTQDDQYKPLWQDLQFKQGSAKQEESQKQPSPPRQQEQQFRQPSPPATFLQEEVRPVKQEKQFSQAPKQEEQPKQPSPPRGEDPASSLKKKQSFIYRTDKFAITSNYQRPANTPAMAPPQFQIPKPSKSEGPLPAPVPVLPVSASNTNAAPANLVNEELEQYDEHARVFSNVDRHAFEVARVQHSSFRDLVWDLIYSQNISDDLEKARALFLWLCTKDLSTMQFKNVAAGSPEEALMGLKSGSQTYAAVFEMLCSFAGLHCVTISGFAKGVDYQPGMRFEGKEALHSWNGVLIDGQWRLVDTHWAARRMVGRRSIDNLRYELDEFFFLTSPRQLIYTHFPHDPSWQLLETRLSLAEFENLPPVKSLFFKLGLKFVADAGQAVLSAAHGERTVQLQFNRSDAASIDFNYALTTDDGHDEFSLPGDASSVKLNRFVFHEITSGSTTSFLLRLPAAGSYRFVVFATPKVSENQAIDRADRAYSAVCEWRVNAGRPATHPVPFPSCSAQRWGPPLAALAESRCVAGLPIDARIYTDSQGIAEIELRKTNPKQNIIFAGKMRAFRGYDEAVLDTSVLHRLVGADKAVFTISAPGRGEFGLDIFTTRPDEETTKGGQSGQRTLFHLCQYLILCEEPTVSGMRFPALPAGYLGAQRTFAELGLSTMSHPDPFIGVKNANVPLEVVFGLPSDGRAVRAVASLLRLTAPGQGAPTEDFSDWVLHQSPLSGDRIAFVCRFPKSGTYKLQIFAQSADAVAQTDSIPGVYNYLIDVSRNQIQVDEVLPFPKQYSQWHEGGFLIEPLDGVLSQSRLPGNTPNRLLVRIAIPRARKVAAVVADTWTHLVAGSDGIWEGVAILDKVWANPNANARRLAVSANFLIDSPNAYATLLEYKLTN